MEKGGDAENSGYELLMPPGLEDSNADEVKSRSSRPMSTRLYTDVVRTLSFKTLMSQFESSCPTETRGILAELAVRSSIETELRKSIGRADWGAVILAGIGYIITLVISEYHFQTKRMATKPQIILKSVCLATTVGLLICIFVRTLLRLELSKHRRKVFFQDSVISHFKTLVGLTIEIIVCSICPLPYINSNIDLFGVDYNVDSVISVFMLMRIYLITRVVKDGLRFRSTQSKILTKLTNEVNLNTHMFTVRLLMKMHPLRFMFIFMTSSTLMFSYSLHVFERATDSRHEFLLNSVWLTLVTMTTVGYGDIYPITTMGRFVCMLSCLTAMIFGALLVVALQEKFMMTSNETRLATTVLFMKKKHDHVNMSARTVCQAVRLAAAIRSKRNRITVFLYRRKLWKLAKEAANLRKISARREFDSGYMVCETLWSVRRLEKQLREASVQRELMHQRIDRMEFSLKSIAQSMDVISKSVQKANKSTS